MPTNRRGFIAVRGTAALAVVLGSSSAGCFRPVVKNGPLAERDPAAGYRFETLKTGPNNTDDVLICLCFSGGGTRAAALSFGVLQALRDTPIPAAGGQAPRRLLDEVDVISSVSGGSFTSMSYGLDRDDVFAGTFEQSFLKRNVQNQLVFMLFRPANLLSLPYVFLDRIDLAANYYEKYVFDQRTYQDLLDRGDRPYLVINATNMALGERFEFTQDDFDYLGSDLSTLPVGHAVAASSAFPLLFSPLRLKYYAGPAADATIDATLSNPDPRFRFGRHYKWASNLTPEAESAGQAPPHTLDGKNHQYLYLLDGGLTDNLGITYVIEQLRTGGLRRMIEEGKIKHFVVIIVDANTDSPEPIEHQAAAPGLMLMAEKTGTTSMYNYSEAMTGVLRFMLRELPERLREADERCKAAIAKNCPDAAPPEPPAVLRLKTYLVEVSLHKIADPKIRRKFLAMPTSLFLTSGQVDSLMDIARTIVTESPDFQRLLTDLNAR